MKGRYFILICILSGIVMRLIWASDMEYKDDEKIMYDLAWKHSQTNTFPTIGMMSGGGVVNPGLSVMIFSIIAHVSNGPVGMASGVAVINVLSLLLLLWFIYKRVPEEEKSSWYFGAALAAVSPLAILFSRKIWAQDTLPLFAVLLTISVNMRDKKQGAFFFGLFGMLIGQIHMSGFFLASGLLIYTLLYDWHHKNKMQWMWLIAGGVIGLLPLIPWIQYITTHKQGSYLILDHVLQFAFYVYSFLDAHGLNLVYTFEKEINSFYQFPFYFLTGIIYLLLAAASIFTLWLIFGMMQKWVYSIRSGKITSLLFFCSTAGFYLRAVFIGLGVLMTFSGTEIYPHYIICVFPFAYVGLSRIYKNHLKVFMLMIVLQAMLSVFFLLYVHQHDGIKNGDYGIVYRAQ